MHGEKADQLRKLITDNGLIVTINTGATAAGKASNSAYTSGDVGQLSLGVRNENFSTLGSADGNYIPQGYDRFGRTYVIGSQADNAGASGNPLLVAAQYNSTAPAYDNLDASYLQSDIKGNLKVAPAGNNTGAKTSVASSATSVTVLASNVNRKGATIYNESTQTLYLDLTGGTASSSSYSVQVKADEYYEVPFNITNALTGIWAAANGNARVTEVTI